MSESTSADVPAPVPPGDGDAWYAPDTVAQYESTPGVVASVHRKDDEFRYEAREPLLSPTEAAALADVRERFEETQRRRPLTRQGALERAGAGFSPKYERVLDRLFPDGPGTRRRLDYHALAELRLLGDATPLALDETVEIADSEAQDGNLVVHTTDFAPVVTDLPVDAEFVDRVAAERVDDETHNELSHHYDERLVLALIFLAAEYVAIGRVISALGVELADEFVGWQLQTL